MGIALGKMDPVVHRSFFTKDFGKKNHDMILPLELDDHSVNSNIDEKFQTKSRKSKVEAARLFKL